LDCRSTQPPSSNRVDSPYNYAFAENLDPSVEDIFKKIISGVTSLTPTFGKLMASVSAKGLKGKNLLGQDKFAVTDDIWGPSKNTLLYVKDSTLPEMANGYAVLLKKESVQQAVADVSAKYNSMLQEYNQKSLWPINGPLEIRVTSLDSGPDANSFDRPIISPLAIDSETIKNGWNVAVWFDILTLENRYSNQFYFEFENWILVHFAGKGRVLPEWSKGWGYNPNPWTSNQFVDDVRATLTNNRENDDNWAYEVATLAKYDAGQLFTSPLLKFLLVAPTRSHDDL